MDQRIPKGLLCPNFHKSHTSHDVSVCVLACCLGASVFCMFLEECVLPILPIPITMVPCG